MPPGPAYNWLCVLHTTAEILANVAKHRAGSVNGIKSRRVENVGQEELDCGLERTALTSGRGTWSVSRLPRGELVVEDVPLVALNRDELAPSSLQKDPCTPAENSPEPVSFLLRVSS
jgi:aarF domain-containing kinase